MIKITELRIGNLYSIEDNFGRWSINDFNSIEKTLTEDELIPIPLTEEWLTKFGFIYGQSEYYNLLHKEINFLLIEYSGGIIAIREIDCSSTPVRLPHIKYIHQLQNLYFSLTGEEFELK